MNEDLEPRERPPLFQVGILLTLLHAGLKLLLLAAVTLGILIAVPIGLANSHGDEGAAIAIAGVVGVVLIGLFAFFCVASIVVCFLAWRRSRGAIWALIGISALSATSFPFGTFVGVLTIIGCVQALERPPE